MPDLRFAIGAVLAIALLIVAVFGLAKTVQVAHHRSTTPDDPWRTLAFPVTAAEPETTATLKTREREVPQETQAEMRAETETAQAAEQSTRDPPATVPAAPPTAPTEPIVAPIEHEPVDVVAAIPKTRAVPVQPAEMPPAIEIPAADDQPPEPSERVGSLPGFPNAGHGFVHPIALPVPLPPSKPAAIKKPQRKKVARSRLRLLRALPGYPLFGFGKLGPHSKTGSDKTTGYDKNWTVE